MARTAAMFAAIDMSKIVASRIYCRLAVIEKSQMEEVLFQRQVFAVFSMDFVLSCGLGNSV